jgi:hypothetical protein
MQVGGWAKLQLERAGYLQAISKMGPWKKHQHPSLPLRISLNTVHSESLQGSTVSGKRPEIGAQCPTTTGTFSQDSLNVKNSCFRIPRSGSHPIAPDTLQKLAGNAEEDVVAGPACKPAPDARERTTHRANPSG